MQLHNHFYSLNDFLRKKYGQKVIKLSIDAGFTCPNRDGSISSKGCIFCSMAGSGDFTPSSKYCISSQLQTSISLLSKKWPKTNKYIAYFQSYSNTYAPLHILKQKYEEALSSPNIVGIAIATRPDCLDLPTLEYLEILSHKTHLWVELGLQSIHEKTALWMNRGYTLDCYEEAVYQLTKRNIEVVTHLILGFPNESIEDMLMSAKYISQLPLQGVKLHMLHILDDAPLGKLYLQQPFPLLSREDYIDLIGKILSILPPHFVIHRLTGDGSKTHLLAPLWTKNKKQLLNDLYAYLKEHDIYQGNSINKY